MYELVVFVVTDDAPSASAPLRLEAAAAATAVRCRRRQAVMVATTITKMTGGCEMLVLVE